MSDTRAEANSHGAGRQAITPGRESRAQDERGGSRKRRLLAMALAGLGASLSSLAFAQNAPADAPPVAPTSDMAPPAPPMPPMPAGSATPAPTPPAPPSVPPAHVIAPTPAPQGPPATKDYSLIKMNYGIRVGARLQNPTQPDKMNDVGLDTIYVEPRFTGEINEWFSWQANFNAGVRSSQLPAAVDPVSGASVPVQNAVGIMDLIAKVDLHDAFHVWAGRLLVPSDRSNFSGPFFMSPWNYPGAYPGAVGFVGPRTGPTGRDNGAVVWGQFVGGKAKYYLGAFNLDTPTVSPLISGRLNFCLLGSEPGFYHSSTYYGSQDIVAIGGALQYQKNAFTGMEDRTQLMADVLAEKNLGAGGVVTLEGAYYHFDSNQPIEHSYFVLASWLTPENIGVGKLQPLVRFQQLVPSASGASKPYLLDAFLTYVIAGYDARIALGYQRGDNFGGGVASNAIQLGLQLQR